MFKPHVTVACVVHAKGKFLVVEETINGKALWNQPAGHLEADETLVQAAERELWEETGIRATPQHFLRLHQWIAPIAPRFCASSLLSSLTIRAPPSLMIAISIAACGSVLRKFLTQQTCVLNWLPRAFAAISRIRATRCRSSANLTGRLQGVPRRMTRARIRRLEVQCSEYSNVRKPEKSDCRHVRRG